MIVVEPGIGSYNKVIAPFAVFESYAVMSHVYAKHDMMPRWMDAVVPNYFDPKDFIDATGTIEETNVKIQDYITSHETSALSKPNVCTIQSVLSLKPRSYVLMIARMITTKGVQVAIEVCRTAGLKLILAGQGLPKDAVSKDFKIDFTDLDCPNGVTHIGYIEPLQRAILIANAKCLLAPTLYAEPFGGVNVEAQMSGVPAITTDWGAFAETVLHGVTGYRCRSMDHFLYALQNVDLLDRKRIRQWALDNYGLTKVATMYEEYFQMLATTKQGRGFYQENPGRLALKWLEKTYPLANK
jgi:glycosyltransferase involved in cell wall biosynthesis